MRIQILRDVVAGCAGALLVLAVIGLPRAVQSDTQLQTGQGSTSQCLWGVGYPKPQAYVPICYQTRQVPQRLVPAVKAPRPAAPPAP
jgi:hypothetical protein